MIVLAILTLLIFCLLAWILFVPLVVDLDSRLSVFQVYQPITFQFALESGFRPNLRIFGMSISLDKKGTRQPEHPKRVGAKKVVSAAQVITLIKRILRSVRVKEFRLDVDTDDVVMNAKLVPAFLLLTRGPLCLTTNFEGRVDARLRAEVWLYRIGWAFLLFNIKHKNYGHEF